MPEWTVTGVTGDKVRVRSDAGQVETFTRSTLENSTRPEAQSILEQAGPALQAEQQRAEEQQFLGTQTAGQGLAAPVEGPAVLGAQLFTPQQRLAQPAPPPAPPATALAPPPVVQAPAAREPQPPAPTQIFIPPQPTRFPAAAVAATQAAQKKAEEAQETFFGGLREQAELQKEQNEQQALAALDVRDKQRLAADIEQQTQFDEQKVRAQKVEMVRAQLQKIEAAEEDFATMRVEDFWASRTTGQKILAGLGMAFGAASAAITGGPNTAMQIINTAIENDMERQKSNIQLGRVRLDQLRGALPRIVGMYDTELEQTAAFRMSALRQVSRDIDALTAGAQSAQMVQNGAILKQGVETQIAAEKMKLAQLAAAAAHEALLKQRIPGEPGRVVEPGAEALKAQGAVDFQEVAAGKDKNFKVNQFVPAYEGFAATKEEAVKLRTLASKRQSVKDFISRLVKFREENDQYNPKEAAQAGVIITALWLKQKDVQNLGVLAGPDMDLLRDLAADPRKIMQFGVDKYRTLLQTTQIAEQNDVDQVITQAVNIPSIRKKGATQTEAPIERVEVR